MGGVLLLASRSSNDGKGAERGSSEGSPSPTTTDVLDEAQIAWNKVLPTLPATTKKSSFELIDGIPTIATGDNAGFPIITPPVVTVWEYRAGTWSPVLKQVTGLPTTGLDFKDVTGEGQLDLLIGGAANHLTTFVFSNVGGSWHLVPWGSRRTDSAGYVMFDSAGRLYTPVNDCTPSCAQGHTSNVYWVYDAATGQFVTK